MPRHDDEYEDYLDDREDPDPEDADWNMDPAVIECPYCRGDITEESEYCPHCDRYLSKEDVPAKRSIWLIAGITFLVVLTVVGWLWMH
jgi:hypothetical protein